MKAPVRTVLFLLQFIVLGLALAYVVNQFWPDAAEQVRGRLGTNAATAPPSTNTAAAISAQADAARAHNIRNLQPSAGDGGRASYADAVSRAAPSVVNIYANKVVPIRRGYTSPLIQRFFGGSVVGPIEKGRQRSLGSGVIFRTDGYVLTNNHVIAGADDIQVLLYDGRVAQAHVIGTDTDTDLAVLKIDASNLPAIVVADQAPANVGDVALAIGNPFGFGKTVTMGIVSATGRQLVQNPYEDFIQTDAAINSGNSGGALVNAYGELIGINTAVFRQSGGAEGFGFAIPVTTAKWVLDQIIANGQVIRGWLGIEYDDVKVPINSGLPAAASGVDVVDMYADGPAVKAGLRVHDILLKLNDEPIVGQNELRNREAHLAPGSKIKMEGLHEGGIPFSAELTLMQRPAMSAPVGG